LNQYQPDLLLAEVAALLHDMGKCADEHIVNQSSDKPQWYSYKYKTAQSHRLPVGLPDVNLLNESVSVRDLIEKGMPRSISVTTNPWLVRVLGKCHSIAHVEKELSDRDTVTKQPKNDTRLSTAYGTEDRAVNGLTALLDSLPFKRLTDRANFAPLVRYAFDHAPGDTRRPVNEVTLADWSDMVAALYKSALAGGLMGIKPDPDALRWRLLCVNFDVLALYAKAVKIADILAYQRTVDEACDRVKKLVEEEYPLGNDVYRDTTGIYFTFPDLGLPADLAHEIRRRVETVEPELAPRIAVTQGDGATATEQLKGILTKARKEALEALAQPFDSQNLSDNWQQQWTSVGQGKWGVCPVCCLRPKREDHEVCETCEKRRGSRIAEWLENPHRTIWIDEIADHNDRVALIVGKFGLDDWLSGDLVQTMLIKAAKNEPNKCVAKNPSPARLRRVWETCQRFWAETAQELLDDLPARERWLLEVEGMGALPPTGAVCDGTLHGQQISVWRIEDALLTVSFLSEQPKAGELRLAWVHDGHKRNGTYQVEAVKRPSADYLCYHPTLTLLSSPEQFLALAPAAEALAIAENIWKEYTKQFGKVQNRLPLFLGLVFFQRKMPLMAVMDTARRMLHAPLKEEKWRVECSFPKENGQKYCVRLSQGDERLSLDVPVKMGDGTTDDHWYPYFFVEHFVDGTPESRPYRFQHNGRWLVHVNNLKEDDVVPVTPSRFTYLWLEHTAKRFAFDPVHDLLLLDELPRLKGLWEALKQCGITDTALRNVQAVLEPKAAAWGAMSKEFQHLVETTLKEAGLYARKDKDGNPLPDVVTPGDVHSGRFARCLELYLHILKKKIKEGRNVLSTRRI